MWRGGGLHACTPRRRSNITARKPPSTLYMEDWKSEMPAPSPMAPLARLLRTFEAEAMVILQAGVCRGSGGRCAGGAEVLGLLWFRSVTCMVALNALCVSATTMTQVNNVKL